MQPTTPSNTPTPVSPEKQSGQTLPVPQPLSPDQLRQVGGGLSPKTSW